MPNPQEKQVHAPVYVMEEGATYLVKRDRDGEFRLRLANWTAKITADISETDGVDQHRSFEMEAVIQGNTTRFRLTPDQFEKMTWVTKHLGPLARVEPGYNNDQHMRAAIQTNSEAYTRRTVYKHTGWIRLQDGWVYAHAGGIVTIPVSKEARDREASSPPSQSGGPIGPVGPQSAATYPVEVSLPPNLSLYRFPSLSDFPNVAVLFDAVIDVLNAAVDIVAFPLVASALRAAIGENDITVHLAGASGILKSSYAAVIQQFFGPAMDEHHLPGHWSSTANALEQIAFTLKDSLLVVDDFVPTGAPGDVHRLHREAERLIREKGNQSGRARCSGDGSLRPARVPRALLITTGEDIPAGMSLRARMFTVEVEAGDIDGCQLAICQAHGSSGRLAGCMSWFILWLAKHRDKLLSDLDCQREEWKHEMLPEGMHRRTWMAAKELHFAFTQLLRMWRCIPDFDDSFLDDLERKCIQALGIISERQRELISEHDIVERFRSLFTALCTGRQIYFEDKYGESWPTQDPAAWGYRKRTIYRAKRPNAVPAVAESDSDEQPDDAQVEEVEVWEPQGRRIGWVNDEFAFIDQELLYTMLQKLAREQGEVFPVTKRTLAKRLVDAGIVIPDAKRQRINTRIMTPDGERVYVLRCDLTRLRMLLRLERNTDVDDDEIAPFNGHVDAQRQREFAKYLLE